MTDPARRGTGTDWSRVEVEATVADYLDMLTMEIAGRPFNKAEHNRGLQRVLDGRSGQAIEFKHCNVSAVLVDLGYPYVDGYKPRSNYQELLREVVISRLEADVALERLLASAVVAPVVDNPFPSRVDAVIVDPPKREPRPDRVRERPVPRAPRIGVNYLQQEARNASLGLAGEEFVLRVEHERLWTAGQRTLAERIEHVSRTQGDGLGYDILSFDDDGRERLIEVKTTRYGVMTPFFATRNEVEVSEREAARYRLYRVFKFAEHPRLFMLPGSLRDSCVLDPVAYRATLP